VRKTAAGLELGIRLRLGLAMEDTTADGLTNALVLGATDTLAGGLAVPPTQPETAMATIALTSSGFATRKGNLFM
jgi:hypothetical protein